MSFLTKAERFDLLVENTDNIDLSSKAEIFYSKIEKQAIDSAAEEFEKLAQHQSQYSSHTIDYGYNYLDATLMSIEKAKRALESGRVEISRSLIHDALDKLNHVLEKLSD